MPGTEAEAPSQDGNRGFLTMEYLGKREQLPASTKGSQISLATQRLL